jgi:hypothetical protein
MVGQGKARAQFGARNNKSEAIDCGTSGVGAEGLNPGLVQWDNNVFRIFCW